MTSKSAAIAQAPEASAARASGAVSAPVAVPVQRVRPSGASESTSLLPLPAYQTAGAAGMDLMADLETPVTLPPLGRALIPTGLAFALPEGYEGQVRPRSGLAAKHGITCLNTPGTIDSDYRGEVKVLLVNLSSEPFEVRRGERVAQLVVAPVTRALLQEMDALPETVRGHGGFGSTGR